MYKKIKYLISSILILIIISITTLVILASVVNPNKYKPYILDFISNKINRQVTIDGNLTWSIIPLGISINQLKITNDPKFIAQEKYFITTKQATLKLDILPLIFKNIKISALELDDPIINLSIDKNGYTNWQSLAKVNHKNNNLVYAAYSESDLGLNSKSESIIDANSTSNNNNQDINNKNTKLNLDIKKLIINNGILSWQDLNNKVKVNNINLKIYDLSLDNLSNSLAPTKITGSANTDIISADIKLFTELNTELQTNITDKIYNLNLDYLNITLDSKKYPNKPKFNINNTKANIDLNKYIFNIIKLNTNLNKIILSGSIAGSLQQNNNSLVLDTLNGKIDINKSNIKQFCKDLNINISDQVYNTIDGSFKFTTDNKKITIKPIAINLDQDKLSGSIDVDTSKNPIDIITNLKLNNINLDRLTISSDLTNITIKPKTQGNIKIVNLKLDKFLQTKFKTNKLSGNADFNLNYNTTGNNSSEFINNLFGDFNLSINNGQLNGINLSAALKVINEKITNKLSPEEILKSAASILGLLGDGSQQVIGDNQFTPIVSLSATGDINNGIISNKDLLIKSPGILITGSGQINLAANKINYTIILHSTNNEEFEIPINITGSLDNPDYNIDPTAFLNSKIFKSIINKNIKTIEKIPGLKNIKDNIKNLDKLIKF